METRELMIGDWVIHDYYKTPIQIKAIPNAEQIYHPIPLTAEILEKNGFKERDKFAWYHKESLFLVNTPNTNKVSITAFNRCVIITYVHELQHALRLCGLNELADNFKV